MIYRFLDCELDTARFDLKRAGTVQAIEPQVFRLLVYLIEHRDRVVTRDELFSTIWEGRVVADSALYSRIKSARAAIGDQGAQAAAIRTVNRTGYQFVAEVDARGTPEPQVVPRPSMRPPSPVRRRQWWAAAAVAALGAVAWGYSIPLHRDGTTGGRPRMEPSALTSTAISIGVLPFADLSDGADQSHFVRGLIEELTDQLARLPGLHIVRGRYPIGTAGAAPLARELGVGHLLEGSVRSENGKVRISAQLLDAGGVQIWSRTYEREHGDALGIQRDVATAVAATFFATPDPSALDVNEGGTSSREAYEAYLAARAALVDPDIASEQDYRMAQLQLRHAIDLDPQFAVAHAWLSLSFVGTDSLPGGYTRALHRQASAAAARAIELAPHQPWALLARARLLMRERRWAEAEKIFLHLQHETPLVESRWNCLACFYMMVGRIEDAIERFEQARLMDPQLATNVLCAGIARAFAGQPGLFAESFVQAGALFGDETRRLRNRAFVAFAGEPQELAAAVRAMSPAPGSLHDRMLANFDSPQTALGELREPGRFPVPTPAYYSPMATWAAHFGDPHLALDFLERSAAESSASYVVWHPVFAEARRLPEFAAVLERFGLIDYWRETGAWPPQCRPVGSSGVECS